MLQFMKSKHRYSPKGNMLWVRNHLLFFHILQTEEYDFSQAEMEVEGKAFLAEEIENRQLLFGAGRAVGA